MSESNGKSKSGKANFSDFETHQEPPKNLSLSIDAALMKASSEKFRLLLERLSTMLPREEFVETLNLLSSDNNMNGDDDVKTLTKKEEEIIIRLAKGQRNKQIAEELFISSHTVRTHRNNIHRKLKIIGKCANPVVFYERYVLHKINKNEGE